MVGILSFTSISVSSAFYARWGARMAQWVRSLDLTTHTSLSPIRHGFAPGFVNYKKGCTRLAATSDKVYQLLTQGRWFSAGTPASSTTKTGHHDIAEILLKVALKHQKSIKSIIYARWRFVMKYNLFHTAKCSTVKTISVLNNWYNETIYKI
jgi:hypothetical protein